MHSNLPGIMLLAGVGERESERCKYSQQVKATGGTGWLRRRPRVSSRKTKGSQLIHKPKTEDFRSSSPAAPRRCNPALGFRDRAGWRAPRWPRANKLAA